MAIPTVKTGGTRATPDTPTNLGTEPSQIRDQPSGAGWRRARFGVRSFILMFAITAVCGFAGIITDRFDWVLDATATREHELSDRALKVLGSLAGEHELIVTVNSAIVDPRAAVRTQNILDAFDRASDNLRCTLIDVGDAKGIERLDGMLRRLVERYSAELARQREVLDSAIERAGEVARALEGTSVALDAAKAAIQPQDPNAESFTRFFESAAGVCRAAANELDKSVNSARASTQVTIGATPVPAYDDGSRVLRAALAGIGTRLKPIIEDLGSLAAAQPDAIADPARVSGAELSKSLADTRDAAARIVVAIDDLPRLPLTPAARILETSSAALVIGPPAAAEVSATSPKRAAAPRGMTAIDIGSLFPALPARQGDGTLPPAPDTRARAEELLSSALASLAPRQSITVVVVHGATEAERLAPEFGPMRAMVDRMRLRGIEVIEWAAAVEPDPPAGIRSGTDADRRVVYVTISTQVSTPGGAARMGTLASVIDRLVQSGASVLLSVAPSELPGVGQLDPMVEAISKATGKAVTIDSGRPLLRRVPGPRGPVVGPDLSLLGDAGGAARHPIAAAIEGLRVQLQWASPIRIDSAKVSATANLAATPLLMAADDDSVWAESEWAGLWNIPRERLPLVINPPSEGRRDDGAGPWVVAAAIRRTNPLSSAAQPQRLVVVGSNLWFIDEFTQAAAMVVNRAVPINPGNLELFEASVMWLAFQDDVITRGVESSAIPTIPPLSGGILSAIRWSLIAGLPLVTLLVGALWRLLRG